MDALRALWRAAYDLVPVLMWVLSPAGALLAFFVSGDWHLTLIVLAPSLVLLLIAIALADWFEEFPSIFRFPWGGGPWGAETES